MENILIGFLLGLPISFIVWLVVFPVRKKAIKAVGPTKKKVDKLYLTDKLPYIGVEHWGLYYEGKSVDGTVRVKTISEGLIAVDGHYYLQVFAETNEEAVTYYCEKFYNYIRT